MTREGRADELLALKEIAETLNISNDMYHMLDAVLRKLLDVTGLKTGWVFLMDEEPDYICVVDQNLPPALTWGDKTPMCADSCWCVDKFWGRRLHKAVNIINCKRIENAIEYNWGDTEGIYHHATVPLKAGGEWFGILNVASPGKEHFSDEELALLESVSYQIGTAIKRTRLYQAQQTRAEMYTKLGDITKQVGKVMELNKIPSEAVKWIGASFQWPSVSFFMKEGTTLSLRALSMNDQVVNEWRTILPADAGPIGIAIREGRATRAAESKSYPALQLLGIPMFSSAIALPIHLRGQILGVLFIASEKINDFDDTQVDVLHSLADHFSITMENARLYQQRHELIKLEERNRLARDLHDSVCQNLFSLTLMTRGLESVLTGQSEMIDQSLQQIQMLTEESLKEMRSLIWQLRPAGLEQGLLTVLKQYGQKLGLTVYEKLEGICDLPRTIEETLWRIGQEALNNIYKHAGVNEVTICIKVTEWNISLQVSDAGRGFTIGQASKQDSMGMISMRERAEMLGGIFMIESKPGEGTTIQISIPFS